MVQLLGDTKIMRSTEIETMANYSFLAGLEHSHLITFCSGCDSIDRAEFMNKKSGP